ncbi:MAG: MFS transporter [Flavobacteriaceae bacterium]|nr:MFS transporter [Flavobacteriaceae bacterium]
MLNKKVNNPWFWVPSLYYAEGLPNAVVVILAGIMYKNLGISNTDLAFYSSWLCLPWVIKPLWSPIVDILKNKRWWIIVMQLFVGVAFAGVAFTINTTNFFQYTLAFLFLLSFSSATHDIAVDGFYMLGLSKSEQAFFVGIRSSFYRIAMITVQGALVILAGFFEKTMGNIKVAWTFVFLVLTLLFLILFCYHFFILPKPEEDKEYTAKPFAEIRSEFFRTFMLFFKKKQILIAIAFLLLYRLGEAQLTKIATPFLLDAKEKGGLALSTQELGFTYGTVGLLALTFGGILGGVLVSIKGLKYWLWYMAIALNLPNFIYVLFAMFQPDSLWIVNIGVAVEQFGYGFGFTAYMLYMIYISEGEHKTAHFALTTGFMALGMMLPGMISGWIQEQIGYQNFFIWVFCCAIPTFLLLPKLSIATTFGKK